MTTRRTLLVSGAALVVLGLTFAAGWVAGMVRVGAAVPVADLPEAERQFSERMHGAALVGRFTIAGRDDQPAVPDRYDLYSVEKVGDDLWRFNAKIGEVGLTIPVVVRMQFVDGTPIILLDDASLPGMGEGFSARVVFDGDSYAGTWGHGARGGHLFGRVERGGARE